MRLSRRDALRAAAAGAAGPGLGVAPAYWRTARAAAGTGAAGAAGPYGPLQPPDANGIMLPRGFSSRVLARGGTPSRAPGMRGT